jgi:hypothetical protein
MDIQDKINESKKRTELMNGVTIDWQYALQIIPTVLPIISKNSMDEINTVELEKLSNTLDGLFSNIENNVRELRTMILKH